MNKANANALAYPHTEYDAHGQIYGEHAGMTKRELIAMNAYVALILAGLKVGTEELVFHASKDAVIFADALLEALEKETD